MSLINLYSSNVKRKKDELARLKKDRVKYVSDASSASQKIIRLSNQLKSTKSASTIKGKYNEINKEEKKKSDAAKKIADYDKKIATKEKELYIEEVKLQKEQEKEHKRLEDNRIMEISSINDKVECQRLHQIQIDNEIRKLKESKDKINILFIASNPDIIFTDEQGNLKEQQKLSLDKEARDIAESIQKSPDRDSINFVTKWATRTDDLFQYINEVNPTVIHFTGHGTEDGKLVFHDKYDNPKLVEIDAIIQMVNTITDDLRLVVFSNCYSSSIAEGVVEYAEATIGMNTSVKEDIAMIFASQLYSSIGFGFSLEKSFNQAMARLKVEGFEDEECNIPELFVKDGLNAKDIYLIKNNELDIKYLK